MTALLHGKHLVLLLRSRYAAGTQLVRIWYSFLISAYQVVLVRTGKNRYAPVHTEQFSDVDQRAEFGKGQTEKALFSRFAGTDICTTDLSQKMPIK